MPTVSRLDDAVTGLPTDPWVPWAQVLPA